MAGATNRGKYRILEAMARGVAFPTTFRLALVKSTPTPDTNVMSDLTEIATGPGGGSDPYSSGGKTVNRDATDVDTLVEDDTNDKAYIQLKDFSWNAAGSGGTIPGDGAGATYAIVTDANATIANREVWFYASLGGAKVSATNGTFTIQNFEVAFTE